MKQYFLLVLLVFICISCGTITEKKGNENEIINIIENNDKVDLMNNQKEKYILEIEGFTEEENKKISKIYEIFFVHLNNEVLPLLKKGELGKDLKLEEENKLEQLEKISDILEKKAQKRAKKEIKNYNEDKVYNALKQFMEDMGKNSVYSNNSLDNVPMGYKEQILDARDTIRISDLDRLNSIVEMYYADNGIYPEKLDNEILEVYGSGDIPKDNLDAQTVKGCKFGYIYELSQERNAYRLSTCLESNEKMKKNDGGIYTDKFEIFR